MDIRDQDQEADQEVDGWIASEETCRNCRRMLRTENSGGQEFHRVCVHHACVCVYRYLVKQIAKSYILQSVLLLNQIISNVLLVNNNQV